MDANTKELLFGPQRRLTADEVLVTECTGMSEGEYLRQVGALSAAHLQTIDEGLKIARITRYAREVQAEGQCLSTGCSGYLTVNAKQLADRVACRIFSEGADEAARIAEEAQALLGAPPSNWAQSQMEDRLSRIDASARPDSLTQAVETVLDAAVEEVCAVSPLSGPRELPGLTQRVVNVATPEAVNAAQAFVAATSGRVAEAFSEGDLRRGAAFIPVVERLIETAATACDTHASELQDEAGYRRADLFRETRRRPAPPANRSKWDSFKGMLSSLLNDFIRDTESVGGQVSAAPPENTTLRAVLRASAGSQLMRRVARELTSSGRATDTARRRAVAGCSIGRTVRQRAEAWAASALAADAHHMAGVQLEAEERVVEFLARRLEALSFTQEISRQLERAEQYETGKFADGLEATARQAAAAYETATLSTIFGQLPVALQDELVKELISRVVIPLRKIDTAIWNTTYLFAAPGGQSGILGRALLRQAGAGRFQVRDWSGLPDTAVAIAWVSFVRPAETKAYHEGKQAMEQLRSGSGEETWLSLYPFARLADEEDPEVNDQQIDELIVAGLAINQIGASKWPAGPPFYLCNGHTGGRPVHTLPAAVKRTLPRLGASVAEMRRTLSRRPELRREIETSWGSELGRAGVESLANKVKESLAADVVGTPELRDAASRLVTRLKRRS